MINTQARVINSQLTHAEVRRQKIETLRFCLGFVYAVKHYLRGEDGADYDDLAGVLPPHFFLHGDLGYATNHGHPVLSHAAMQVSTSDTSINDRRSVDATKRVKRKRSKKNTGPQAHTPSPTTPLLGDSHQTVEFHPYADHISMPLPLMFVFYVALSPRSNRTSSSSITHEITSAIFRFKREGLLETVGPAGKTDARFYLRCVRLLLWSRGQCDERIASYSQVLIY